MGSYAPGVSESVPSDSVYQFNSVLQTVDLLANLNEQAQERLDRIIQQMKEAEGVTETLKAADPMAWVQRMNGIRNRAEEIILREMIYGEETV